MDLGHTFRYSDGAQIGPGLGLECKSWELKGVRCDLDGHSHRKLDGGETPI